MRRLQTAQRSNRPTRNNVRRLAYNAQSRWQVLLEKKGPKAIWASKNWKGKIELNDGDRTKPGDKVFRRHFEKFLNPVPNSADITVPYNAMYVPMVSKKKYPARRHPGDPGRTPVCHPRSWCPSLTAATRFVGRSLHAQKTWHMPFDS